MTRVLIVHQPIDGGVGRHVADLANGLTDAGTEIVLCGPAVPAGVRPGIGHVPLAMRRAVSPAADLRALRRLRAIVREVNPDIVHAHSSKAGALTRLAMPGRFGPPVVYTPHGFAFNGFFARESERKIYRAVERLLAPLTSRLLCVCEAEARLARGLGVPDRVRVVYNGIAPLAPGRADDRMTQLRERGPVVCTLTLLRPGKGLETLIDAAAPLLQAVPGAQIAIWGDGEDGDALRARAQRAGVSHAVHFAGATSDPAAVLRGATAFVLPSWAESFPYVILEAMSAERPIVASDVGGIHEALDDGRTGLLVEPGAADQLAEALISVLADPEAGGALGARAGARARDRFGVGQMLDGVLGVYGELLG